MQKTEYQKNTGGHGVADEILGIFYDNIHHAEFIAQEDAEGDLDPRLRNRTRPSRNPSSRTILNDSARSGKLDPYLYILESSPGWQELRVPLKDALRLDDIYNYQGTVDGFDISYLREAFSSYGTLEVVSLRSRPDAFAENSTIQNPLEASPGLVAIRVVKVGLLWRKEPKRRKMQSPWQQWGALLTPSGLYFFRNHSWTKSMITQVEAYQKTGTARLIFKPPLEEFKPDHTVPIRGVVALLDQSYDKHKHAFVLARQEQPIFEETLLADNEAEMNDWLAKLNYGAAFHWDTSSDSSTSGQDSAQAKSRKISELLKPAQESYALAKERLEENLRNGRHLQILVPWSQKTRAELLAFAPVIELRVRYSKYTVCRLQCEYELLRKGWDYHTNPAASRAQDSPVMSSQRTTSRVGALSRWNSRAGSLVNVPRSILAKSSASANSPVLTVGRSRDVNNDDVGRGSHSVSRVVSGTALDNAGNAFHLPPLRMGSGTFSIPSSVTAERPLDQYFNPSVGEQVDHLSDTHENLSAEPRKHAIPRKELPTGLEKIPSEGQVTDQYDFLKTVPGSPGNRKKRRSMPRTLRDSKELEGIQQFRPRKSKDSSLGNETEVATTASSNEDIKRGPGSFTIHGKQASVIQLSPEWQHMSAEERLRHRKEKENGDFGNVELDEHFIDGGLTANDQNGTKRYSTTASGSNRTSYHSVLEDGNTSLYGSDIFALDYPGPQSQDGDTQVDHTDTVTSGTTTAYPFAASTVRKPVANTQIPHKAEPASGAFQESYALRTFLEDGSTTDDDPQNFHEQVGLAIGGL